MSKALTHTVCGLRKCALWTAFEAFAFKEQKSSLALGAKVLVEASLALWSFAFWEIYEDYSHGFVTGFLKILS